MSSQPLVSVIVPTYNYGHFINLTFESIQGQTYQNWECVVVDDGSNDNTREVVANYAKTDKRIKYFYQDNQGQPVAMNTGVKNSIGKYLQFLDADDLIEAKKLERQVEYLEQHPEVDIVYGDVRFFSTENMHERLNSMSGDNQPWITGVSGTGDSVLLPLVRLDNIPVNTPLIRKSLTTEIGPFDETLSPIQDWDFWIRCAAAGKRFQFEDIEGTYALVRYHQSSASKNALRMFTVILRMRRKVMAMALSPEVMRLNKELAAETEGALGVQHILHGSISHGVSQLGKAAILDRNLKHRMKWFVCAVAAPFVGPELFRKLYNSSITQAVTGQLRQLQPSRRR